MPEGMRLAIKTSTDGMQGVISHASESVCDPAGSLVESLLWPLNNQMVFIWHGSFNGIPLMVNGLHLVSEPKTHCREGYCSCHHGMKRPLCASQTLHWAIVPFHLWASFVQVLYTVWPCALAMFWQPHKRHIYDICHCQACTHSMPCVNT